MAWLVPVLGLLGIDAQKNPIPVLILVAAFCALLWFLVGQSNRRDARRAERRRSPGPDGRPRNDPR